MSVLQTGTMMLPMAVVSVCSAFVAARVIAVHGPRLVLGIAGFFLLLTGLALALIQDSSTPVWVMLVVALVAGVPNGFSSIGNQGLIDTVASVEKVGTATGIYKTIQYIAAILSAVIVAVSMSAGSGSGSSGATDAGLTLSGLGDRYARRGDDAGDRVRGRCR